MPPRSGPPEAARRLRRLPVGGPPQAKKNFASDYNDLLLTSNQNPRFLFFKSLAIVYTYFFLKNDLNYLINQLMMIFFHTLYVMIITISRRDKAVINMKMSFFLQSEHILILHD